MSDQSTQSKTAVAGRVSASAATVTVACKYPPGLDLRVFEMVEGEVPSPMGPHRTKVARQKGAAIRIHGTGTPPNVVRDDPLVAGYALTRDVPADFWALWLEQNADSDLVQQRLIFAYEAEKSTIDRAKRQRKEGISSGMEGLDPKNPPKFTPPGFRMKMETADEQKGLD